MMNVNMYKNNQSMIILKSLCLTVQLGLNWFVKFRNLALIFNY